MLQKNTTFIVPTVSSAIVLDAETSIVVQLNTLLSRSGLHLSTPSTQLHIMPERVYVLSSKDIAIFSRHARLLVVHKAVQCDFSAFCGVLWGHVKHVDSLLDNYMQVAVDREGRLQETASRQLLPHIVLLGQVFNILRHIEEPFAREEVKASVSVVQQDVEMVVRVAMKVSRVLENAIKNIRRKKTTTTTTMTILLREAELCLARTELFAASVVARNTIDVNPVLTFFNSDLIWGLSGVGTVLTSGYCEAIRRLICAIFSRQEDFVGVEEVTAQLLVYRLANRPPFEWDMFRLLYFSRNTGKPSVGSPTPQYGILYYLSIVQMCVELLLLSEESWAKALRRLSSQALRQLNGQKKMLSFFQIPVLGALEGMPEVDLTDDAQLKRRAVETRLSATDDKSLILHPNFLRILLAHGYTVSQVRHSALSRNSALSLLRAIAEQLFQVPIVRSGVTVTLTDLPLIPPVLTERLLQLIVDATASDTTAAREVSAELRQITEVFYVANTSQCASLLSAQKMPIPLQRLSVTVMRLLFKFFESDAFISSIDRFIALESLARVFAVQAFYVSAYSDSSHTEKRTALQFIMRMSYRLVFLAQEMTAKEINSFFKKVILPCNSTEELQRKNRQQYALQEAYVRAFASSAVAFVIDEDTMLRHWVDVAIRCITNSLSGALSVAGLDFLSAAFLSKRALAPLFVPTYVSLMVPIMGSARYGDPPLFLVRCFAKSVRATCQALEECDAQALVRMLKSPDSSLKRFLLSMYTEEKDVPLLENVGPINCVVLIVSSLFDKVCQLLGSSVTAESSSFSEERFARFQAYFSALINLLKCRHGTVLRRVCASVEAVLLEHLYGVQNAQARWMKYVTSTVDSIEGAWKKELVEWLLTLKEKMKGTTPQSSRL